MQHGGIEAASLDALAMALAAGDPSREIGLRLRIGTMPGEAASRRAVARLAGTHESTLRDTERRLLEIDASVRRRHGVSVLPADVRRRLGAGGY